jgi:hypothetical protein
LATFFVYNGRIPALEHHVKPEERDNMKRFALILGAAALTAISAPITARAQTGCSWWDLTCNGLASRVTDYGWHIAGRDQYGNVLYVRRLVDSNGNVVYEQARRNDFGQYQMLNTHTIRHGTVYNANGDLCKYESNRNGYKEECKYARPIRADYHAPKYKPVKYEPIKYKPIKYKPIKYDAPKVIHYDRDVKGPKPHKIDFHAEKPHGEKGKGPKH